MMNGHPKECMCDHCIKARTRATVQARETDAAQRAYEKRRGEPIGSGSVAEALRQKRS